MSKAPTPEEKELYDALMTIMDGKQASALLVYCKTETSDPRVFCLTDFEEGFDLAQYAGVELTEKRRRVQYPEDYRGEAPDDDGA